jgi:hypothetical protein
MIEAHEAQDKATDAAASHLRPNHRELLRKRSLRDETIVAAGLSSQDHPVYGLSLAIPFIGHDGNLVQYWDGSARSTSVIAGRCLPSSPNVASI